MSYIPDGRGALAPGLAMPDVPVAIEFYQAAFGATVASTYTDDRGAVLHAELDIDGSRLILGPDSKTSTVADDHPNICLSLYVPDVDATVEQALAAGATLKSAPGDRAYGVREAGLFDPFGVLWWVSTPLAVG
ncbi:VOC family protein [Actinopolymorpha sp. B17G11]|uniref:VOC family protein n=1 Tax=unclassified Actinopolymorpha TaxID=2627063 RepID=UPI0032D8C7F8